MVVIFGGFFEFFRLIVHMKSTFGISALCVALAIAAAECVTQAQTNNAPPADAARALDLMHSKTPKGCVAGPQPADGTVLADGAVG